MDTISEYEELLATLLSCYIDYEQAVVSESVIIDREHLEIISENSDADIYTDLYNDEDTNHNWLLNQVKKYLNPC